GKMDKRKDLSEFDKGQIVMARRLDRASPKLQLLWGVPGLQCRRPVRVPMLTPVPRQKRQQWAREHQNWTMEQWKVWPGLRNHVFFYMDGCACASLTWGTHGTRMHYGKKASRQRQCHALGNVLLGNLGSCHPCGCYFDTRIMPLCHKAEMVQEWFDEHNKEFEVLTWPPNSPDLNPIEHLWDVLDKQVRSMKAPPHNLEDLRDLLLTSRCQIPQHTFWDLVESMP
ncbi:hypothetical protein QTP70_033324, partial [Hemibagrus guttatus]